jgi:hypothetical protein
MNERGRVEHVLRWNDRFLSTGDAKGRLCILSFHPRFEISAIIDTQNAPKRRLAVVMDQLRFECLPVRSLSNE